jgi:Zn-dependent M28 family amino/carboxypeptidase
MLGERLRAHVRTLAGTIGERNLFRPRALADSAEFVTCEFRAQGYGVTPHAYEIGGIRCANLEAVRPGRSGAEDVIVVGAHYDSVLGSPGANDNASGVATLLEISRFLADVEPATTVRFVAFVNEEPPFFSTDGMGSRRYAEAARIRGDSIRVMLALETIGYYSTEAGSQHYPPLLARFYPRRGDFLAFVGNVRSRRILRRVVTAFRAHSDFPVEYLAALGIIPGVTWSDHASFWRHGYRALMVTDTAPYRYPHYHDPEDTPEKLSYDALARVADGLRKSVAALATQEA